MSLRGYLSYLPIPIRDKADAVGTRYLRCPRDIIDVRRNPLSSRHRPPPSLPACYPMRPRYASRRVRSMTPRHRSPCGYARPRPRHPVRCAPPQRSVSTVTMSGPWLICPGRSTACASSSACASGSAAIATAAAASLPNACPRWPPPGRGARCGSPSASWTSAWPWGARPGCASASAWSLAVSRNTLLRLLRRLPVPSYPDPHRARGG